MSEERPNVVLVMTDQQRGDALGVEGHPVLQTPQLDWLASGGARFTSAYSACPVCIPARRTLMTGQRPPTQGTLMNHATWLHAPTLPQMLGAHGYQTALCGKLHLWPFWRRYGFEHFAWSDGPFARHRDDDYLRYLRRHVVDLPDSSAAHGLGPNASPAKPWHLDENFHFTNWCVTEAIEFLERRDPTRPFFLNVSFLHPHQPYTPPRDYYDRYIHMDLPAPYIGDWARVYDEPQRGYNPRNVWRFHPDERVMHQARAAYYAAVNHIDDQIARLMERIPTNTVIVFCSDHGEMLGDHQWFRKRTPFEPSARIPLLVYSHDAHGLGLDPGQRIDEPVELMDVMPTLLEAAGAEVPATVEGASLWPLLRGEDTSWRGWVHGECASVPTLHSGMQYATDGKRKYVWWPGLGTEQFFDLESDPCEMHDLAGDGRRREEIGRWRARLIEQLEGRPERFVHNGGLATLDGPTPSCILNE